MQRHYRISWLLLPAIIVLTQATQAQIGFGAGLSSIGESAKMAGSEFEALFEKNGDALSYGDLSGEIGFYGMVSYKNKLGKGGGGLRLSGEASYNYFQASRVSLTSLSVNSDTTIDATFEVGTSLIPISLGLEYMVPIEGIHPYIGAYPLYTFVNRTYTRIEGTEIAGIENVSAGENEFGAAAEAGLEFGLGNELWIAVRLRYSMMNAFTAAEGEASSGLLQLGASLWIGDLSGGNEGDRVHVERAPIEDDN